MREVICIKSFAHRFIKDAVYTYTPFRTNKGSVKGAYISCGGPEQTEYIDIVTFNDHFEDVGTIKYTQLAKAEMERQERLHNARSNF